MNNQGQDLTNKVVVVKQNNYTGTTANPLSRLFHCQSGQGCLPSGGYPHIRGAFLKNVALPKTEIVQIDGNDIERLATDREIEMAK